MATFPRPPQPSHQWNVSHAIQQQQIQIQQQIQQLQQQQQQYQQQYPPHQSSVAPLPFAFEVPCGVANDVVAPFADSNTDWIQFVSPPPTSTPNAVELPSPCYGRVGDWSSMVDDSPPFDSRRVDSAATSTHCDTTQHSSSEEETNSYHTTPTQTQAEAYIQQPQLTTPILVATPIQSDTWNEPNTNLPHSTSLPSVPSAPPSRVPQSRPPAAKNVRALIPLPLAIHAPVAKKACIPCRKLKASCDDVRPCTRCVKFGRECVDRSESEVEHAKIRRKRTGGAATTTHKNRLKRSADTLAARASDHSITSIPAPISDDLHSHSEFLSLQLYSRSLLSVLTQLDLRGMILRLHAELDSLPLQLSTLLHWHSQTSMLLMNLADSLQPNDLTFFLTNGLTPEQIDSPFWMNSPLAPWAKLSTRPMHYAIQQTEFTEEEREKHFIKKGTSRILPKTNQHHQQQQQHQQSTSNNPLAASVIPPPAVPSASPPAPHPSHCPSTPQLRIEWLPSSNLSFQRWQRHLARQLTHAREVRANRTPFSRRLAECGVGLDTNMTGTFAPETNNGKEHTQQQGNTYQAEESNSPCTLSVSSSPSRDIDPLSHTLECAELRVQLKRALSCDPGSDCPAGDCLSSASIDRLASELTCLDIARSLAAPPPLPGPDDQVTNLHASWCPVAEQAWNEQSVKEETKKQCKANTQASQSESTSTPAPYDGGFGVTGPSSSFSPLAPPPPPPCVCEYSTPLPARVLVNVAFERTSGWHQSDVEIGFAREGHKFMRRFYPVSSWPYYHKTQVEHWKTMIEYVGLMSIHAATLAFKRAVHDSTPMQPRPTPPTLREDFIPTMEIPFLTRAGELRRVTMHKCVHVHTADGVRDPSAYVIAWDTKQTETNTNQTTMTTTI